MEQKTVSLSEPVVRIQECVLWEQPQEVKRRWVPDSKHGQRTLSYSAILFMEGACLVCKANSDSRGCCLPNQLHGRTPAFYMCDTCINQPMVWKYIHRLILESEGYCTTTPLQGKSVQISRSSGIQHLATVTSVVHLRSIVSVPVTKFPVGVRVAWVQTNAKDDTTLNQAATKRLTDHSGDEKGFSTKVITLEQLGKLNPDVARDYLNPLVIETVCPFGEMLEDFARQLESKAKDNHVEKKEYVDEDKEDNKNKKRKREDDKEEEVKNGPIKRKQKKPGNNDDDDDDNDHTPVVSSPPKKRQRVKDD